MTIRVSVPDDAEAVERLRIAGWQTAYRGILPDEYLDGLPVDVARRRRHLESLPADLIDEVVVTDEGIVGWIASGPCRDPDRKGPRCGEIYACYVHPDQWRKGTGRVLMGHAIDGLARAGRDDISLWVLEGNDRARRFYETCGFGPDGMRKLMDFGEPVPEVRYRRQQRPNHGISSRFRGTSGSVCNKLSCNILSVPERLDRLWRQVPAGWGFGQDDAMAVPGDAGRVMTAIRLGWYIAEVRGRNRPDAPPGAKAGLPGPPSHALPLHSEQTPTELRIQAQAELAAMAGRLGVDGQIGQVSYSTAIDNQAKRLASARAAGVTAAAAAAAGGIGAGPAIAGGTRAGPSAAGGIGAGPAAVSGTAAGPATPGGAGMAGGSTWDAGTTGSVTAGAATAAAGAAPGGAAPGGVASGGVASGGAAPGGVAPGAAAGTATAAPATDGAVGDPAAQWDVLQDLIFHFDQHIQDVLASEADTVAGGYQLGRALAEPYWALEPDLPNSVKSPAAWWFLLGPERCSEISRLVGRLSAYFHPYTAAAIAGSVQVWKHVATDPTWRENADDNLYLQIRRWYELVVMKQDPTTLVQPYALIRSFRMMKRALRIFWPELSGAVIAAAALSAFAVALGEHNINSFLKSALGFIAITGFSLAGLTAKLKNQAQAMVTRLRQDVYTDLIAVQISTAPLPPAPPPKPGVFASQRKAIVKSRQKATVTRMVRERNITPVTPN